MLAYVLARQLIVNAAPTPEHSAQILANLESAANFTKRYICTDCTGPHVAIVQSRAEDGPFGPFPYYPFTPLGCCSSYFGYNGYAGYYSGPWWSQSAYVLTTPVVSRGGLWRGGSVLNAGRSIPV